jgi:osmotically-inducible protein OsmY
MTQTLQVSDIQLKDAVLDELRWVPSINATHVGVAVNEGAVTLSGEVDSYPEKLLAGQAAQRIRGVLGIAQEITVRSLWSDVNDTDIARRAGQALRFAIDVPDTIHVAVREHDITLSGEAMWDYQREAAHRAVQYIRGVHNVINTVTLTPRVTTANIKSAIEAALSRHARIEGEHVTVTTDSLGVVTLTGRVNSWLERREAETVSWGAPGVTGVTNHLRIGW